MRKRSPAVGLGAWVTSYSTPCPRGCTTRGAAVGLSLTEEWIQIGSGSKVTTEEWLIPAADPTAAPRVVQPREQGVEYEVTHAPSPTAGDRFLILTNADGAVNFKLMTAQIGKGPGREGGYKNGLCSEVAK